MSDPSDEAGFKDTSIWQFKLDAFVDESLKQAVIQSLEATIYWSQRLSVIEEHS